MRESSRYIILIGVLIGYLSSLYFLSLVFHVPFIATLLIILASFYFIYKWIITGKNNIQPVIKYNNKLGWASIFILFVALYFMSANALIYAQKYGQSDAMSIWNFHAMYLADPDNWQKIFQNTEHSHADYPLCLPAIIAFFMRLLSSDTITIPFVLCILIVLCIPMIIFKEISGRNFIVALFTLVVIAFERYYTMIGVAEYADILVAFFFLCAFICADHMQADKKYLILCAYFLACCAWTKNEGAILAITFLAYYGTTFFSRQNIKFTLAGVAIPAIALIVFKWICNVHNDLLTESNGNTLNLLFQKERYIAIFNSYMDNISLKFLLTTTCICVYILICIIEKKLLNKQLFILLSCLFIYSMIYVVTPKKLEWHLKTSQSRLMIQLMPALLYVMAYHIAQIEFVLPKWMKFFKS